MQAAEMRLTVKSLTVLCSECRTLNIDEARWCCSCGAALDERCVKILPSGTRLDRGTYTITGFAGIGRWAITYMARQKNQTAEVALREYYPGELALRDMKADRVLPAAEDSIPAFEKGKELFEAAALRAAALDDTPHIAGVRHVFSENGTVYMVEDYIEGPSLSVFLGKRGKLSFEQALEIMEPVLEGLSRIHAKGILHRNISPFSIVISGDYACLRGPRAPGENGESTAAYTAPEIGLGPAAQRPALDVYSAAATLYRMVTGSEPQAASDRISHDTMISPADVGADVTRIQSDIIMEGLALEPSGRTPSIQNFLESLRAQSRLIKIDPVRKEIPKTKKREEEPEKSGDKWKKILVAILVCLLFAGAIHRNLIGFLSGNGEKEEAAGGASQENEALETGPETSSSDVAEKGGQSVDSSSSQKTEGPLLRVTDEEGTEVFSAEEGYKGKSMGSILFYDLMMEQICRDLGKIYRYSREEALQFLRDNALTVESTIDSALQSSLDRAITEAEEKGYKAAAVVTDRATGAVLAVSEGSGGISINEPHQPGSLFMIPAVFAPAFDRYGFTGSSTASNEEFSTEMGTHVNNLDHSTSRQETYRQGIVHSLFNVAGHALHRLTEGQKENIREGAANSLSFLTELGFTTLSDEDCTEELALGELTRGVTLPEINTAFSIMTGNGVMAEPKYYSLVKDREERVILDAFGSTGTGAFTGNYKRVMQVESCRMIETILQDTVHDGTAFGLRIYGKNVGGKTGLSLSGTDAWACGFADGRLMSVWTGLSENRTDEAQTIWKQVMEGR